MGWGFDRSELRQESWEAAYYACVMSLLRHVELCGHEVFGVSPSRAGRIADILSKYAKVSEFDSENPTTDMTIYVSMFPKEFLDMQGLVGYAFGGGVCSWRVPDIGSDEMNIYINAVAEKSHAYFVRRKAEREEEQRKQQERKLENERKRKHKQEREDVLLQRIRDYVSDCEARGEKPVKKRMMDDEFTLAVVYRVWKRFDDEKAGV